MFFYTCSWNLMKKLFYKFFSVRKMTIYSNMALKPPNLLNVSPSLTSASTILQAFHTAHLYKYKFENPHLTCACTSNFLIPASDFFLVSPVATEAFIIVCLSVQIKFNNFYIRWGETFCQTRPPWTFVDPMLVKESDWYWSSSPYVGGNWSLWSVYRKEGVKI